MTRSPFGRSTWPALTKTPLFRIFRALDSYLGPIFQIFANCRVRPRNDLVPLLNPRPNLNKIVVRNSRLYRNEPDGVPLLKKDHPLQFFSGLSFQFAQVHPCLLFAVLFEF